VFVLHLYPPSHSLALPPFLLLLLPKVRVTPNYDGLLTLKVTLVAAGTNKELAVASDVEGLVVDKTPVDAIGVLCNPTVVAMGGVFNLNLWYTQTHKR